MVIKGDESIVNLTYLAGRHDKGIPGPTKEFTGHSNLQTGHDHCLLGRNVVSGACETRAWSERRS